MHPGYKFQTAPIVVGAIGCIPMGYVPKWLVTYPEMVGFDGKKNQNANSISGGAKISKTFLNFNNFNKWIQCDMFVGRFLVKIVNNF